MAAAAKQAVSGHLLTFASRLPLSLDRVKFPAGIQYFLAMDLQHQSEQPSGFAALVTALQVAE
jgi:hypothetical protein